MTNEVKNTARSIARLRIRKFRAALVEITDKIAFCEKQGFVEEVIKLKESRDILTKRLNRLGQTYI